MPGGRKLNGLALSHGCPGNSCQDGSVRVSLSLRVRKDFGDNGRLPSKIVVIWKSFSLRLRDRDTAKPNQIQSKQLRAPERYAAAFSPHLWQHEGRHQHCCALLLCACTRAGILQGAAQAHAVPVSHPHHHTGPSQQQAIHTRGSSSRACVRSQREGERATGARPAAGASGSQGVCCFELKAFSCVHAHGDACGGGAWADAKQGARSCTLSHRHTSPPSLLTRTHTGVVCRSGQRRVHVQRPPE